MNENINNSSTDGKEKLMRDIDFYNDISGKNAAGRSKATVGLRWFEKNSDGSETEVMEIEPIQKPIVNIVKRFGYVNVFLNYGRRIDVDLRNAWEMLMSYFSPVNSVSYTEEELESGVFNLGDGTPDRLVYFPLLQVIFSPVGHESEYVITGLNPVSVSITPIDITGEPCVIQMVFDDEWFFVSDVEQIDAEQIKQELIESIQQGEYQDYMH